MLHSRAELFRVHGECRALRIIEELRLCYIHGLGCKAVQGPLRMQSFDDN